MGNENYSDDSYYDQVDIEDGQQAGLNGYHDRGHSGPDDSETGLPSFDQDFEPSTQAVQKKSKVFGIAVAVLLISGLTGLGAYAFFTPQRQHEVLRPGKFEAPIPQQIAPPPSLAFEAQQPQAATVPTPQTWTEPKPQSPQPATDLFPSYDTRRQTPLALTSAQPASISQEAPNYNVAPQVTSSSSNPALIAQIQESIKRLEGKIDASKPDVTCPTEEQDEAIKAKLAEMQQELDDLKQTKDFLLSQNKNFVEKNNFLRKAEKNQREKIKKLEADLEHAKKYAVRGKVQKLAETVVQSQSAADKPKGPALPKGWKIVGMCPTMISVENTKSQVSETLEIGDKLDGVEIKGINMKQRIVITSNGVAYYKSN